MSEYIKREDALKNYFCVEVAEYETECVVTLDDIRAIPAADVEPVVRGEWIVKGNNPIDGTCSVCGARGNWRTKRCHDCGAYLERSGSGDEK